MNNDELIDRFPWLTDDDLKVLEKRPWLVLYLEDDDESLTEARTRHRMAQKEARIELRKRGQEPHRRMAARGGITTTAFEDPLEKEMR